MEPRINNPVMSLDGVFDAMQIARKLVPREQRVRVAN